jgi:DNA polymerase-3 subunit gamma/tau
MSYVAFARKYRPRTFDDLIGQESIAQALRGAVAADRTASVYLFSGSHGVGKTSMARILAKALNCEKSQEGRPCLACPQCLAVDSGESMNVLEIDAASNRGVEDAERIRQNAKTRSPSGRFKVYILDEVHHAVDARPSNALLKTLEEAPAHVVFVLATTDLQKVLPTIRSRAQVFHFHRATRAGIETRLRSIVEAEAVAIAPAALTLIARRAKGSMRDAQKLLDQVVSLAPGGTANLGPDDVADLLGGLTDARVEQVLSGLASGDASTLLVALDGYLARGGRSQTFVEDLQEALRAVLHLKACGADSPLVAESAHDVALLQPLAAAWSEDALLYSLQLLQEGELAMRQAREPRLLVEVALVRLARARELRPLGELIARLERLEEALGGSPGPGPAGPAPRTPEPRAAQPAPPPKAAAPAPKPAAPAPTPAPRAAAPAPAPAPPSGGSKAAAPATPPPGGSKTPPPAQSRRGYSYPAELAPDAPAPAPASPPPAAPAELTARDVVELDRAARLDRPTLSEPALESAWHQVGAKVHETLGPIAAAIEKGKPRFKVEGDAAVFELTGVSEFSWKQLESMKLADVLSTHLGQVLGAPPRSSCAGPRARPPGRPPRPRRGARSTTRASSRWPRRSWPPSPSTATPDVQAAGAAAVPGPGAGRSRRQHSPSTTVKLAFMATSMARIEPRTVAPPFTPHIQATASGRGASVGSRPVDVNDREVGRARIVRACGLTWSCSSSP